MVYLKKKIIKNKNKKIRGCKTSNSLFLDFRTSSADKKKLVLSTSQAFTRAEGQSRLPCFHDNTGAIPIDSLFPREVHYTE